MEKSYRVICLGCFDSFFIKAETKPCSCPACDYTAVAEEIVEKTIPKPLREKIKIDFPQPQLKVS